MEFVDHSVEGRNDKFQRIRLMREMKNVLFYLLIKKKNKLKYLISYYSNYNVV